MKAITRLLIKYLESLSTISFPSPFFSPGLGGASMSSTGSIYRCCRWRRNRLPASTTPSGTEWKSSYSLVSRKTIGYSCVEIIERSKWRACPASTARGSGRHEEAMISPFTRIEWRWRSECAICQTLLTFDGRSVRRGMYLRRIGRLGNGRSEGGRCG